MVANGSKIIWTQNGPKTIWVVRVWDGPINEVGIYWVKQLSDEGQKLNGS